MINAKMHKAKLLCVISIFFLKVVDYAMRKNSTVEEVEKWLQVNLAYQN